MSCVFLRPPFNVDMLVLLPNARTQDCRHPPRLPRLTLAPKSKRETVGGFISSSLLPPSTFDALALAPNARRFGFGLPTHLCLPSVWRSRVGHLALRVAQTVHGSSNPLNKVPRFVPQTRIKQCSGSVLPFNSCHTTEGPQLADTDAVTQVRSLLHRFYPAALQLVIKSGTPSPNQTFFHPKKSLLEATKQTRRTRSTPRSGGGSLT
jgi:hypothetical protein